MSRTIRRKHFAREQGKVPGSKTALRWTHQEFHWEHGSNHRWWHTYRPMTKEERAKQYKDIHTDKWTYRYRRSSRTSTQWQRLEQHTYRSQCEAQLKRFMKGEIEDVVLGRLMIRRSWHW